MPVLDSMGWSDENRGMSTSLSAPDTASSSTQTGVQPGTDSRPRTDPSARSGSGVAAIEQRLVLNTPIPGPKSAQLHARKNAAVPAGVSTGLPIYVERAGGGIVVDVDGNQLIDFGSGIAVTTVGNSAPRVVERVQQQVADFTHTCFMVTPYAEYVEVAEALNELTPGDHEKRSALFNSGAEAVENAIKIARSATGRQAVVAFDHGYHGRTNLTMALTAKNMPYKHRFGPFASEIYRVPMAYPYRWPTGPEHCADEAFAAFASAVHAQVGEENTAAVLLEPIQGEGGFIVPAPGFVRMVADWCAEHGILFIADEIQTGFCRTGDWFACEFEGVVPDLITTAKGIAGGLPLSGLTGRAELMDAVHAGGLGGTYGGNPVACAAALGAIETMKAENLTGRATQVEALILPRLQELAAKYDQIGDIRGRGAMLAVELVGGAGDLAPNSTLTGKLNAYCGSQGLVTLTAGTYANVLRFLPPLSIGDDLLSEGLDILEQAFAASV
ncbi:MAG: 4-aminobutyrate aminotransferase / (S)-3-amino-2-methylpropionate transaminase / 5-aminovalerate [Pseudonocardiales bacterium]|nr:4-aminobutyrate aminotransferase / (S)-3-amino-2-methylpropionate transaminase / 5-aminovalerate [Pseudonocardiales bacterium]